MLLLAEGALRPCDRKDATPRRGAALSADPTVRPGTTEVNDEVRSATSPSSSSSALLAWLKPFISFGRRCKSALALDPRALTFDATELVGGPVCTTNSDTPPPAPPPTPPPAPPPDPPAPPDTLAVAGAHWL